MALPLMIFAAGFGTRMGSLTRDRPKPMIDVAGKPLIDHALRHAEEAGAGPVVVNLHYKPAPLAEHLKGRRVTCITETPDILDTGGGLRNAEGALATSPVWTMNPDAVWQGPNPLSTVAAHWDARRMDALLLCVPLERALGRDGPGDLTLHADGTLSRSGPVVFGGVQILKTEALAAIPDRVFSLNRVWDHLMTTDRCHGCLYPGTWCDVGRPENIRTAEKMLGAARV